MPVSHRLMRQHSPCTGYESAKIAIIDFQAKKSDINFITIGRFQETVEAREFPRLHNFV
jgi:hypothetical protein